MKRWLSKNYLKAGVQGGIAFLFLLPLLWMVSASLHPAGVPLPSSLRLFTAWPTLENYWRVWELTPLGRYTFNSIGAVALGVPITLVTASWAGLAISRLPLASQRRWIVISLAVLMVPGIALWMTRFFLYRAFGLFDTVWALIAPAFMGSSPFYVLIFYRAFRRIPAGIFDAAQSDGANILQIWALVVMPIIRPTIIGVGILAFITYWGDFLSPLLYLRTQSHFTLPVALQLFQQLSRTEWALLMAAAVWASFIPVALFLLVQPYFNKNFD